MQKLPSDCVLYSLPLTLYLEYERVIERFSMNAAGRGNCVQQRHNLQDAVSVDDFLNVAATETVPLFEYLEFGFLFKYDVFTSALRGRTRVHG